jgi:hypothetical protein
VCVFFVGISVSAVAEYKETVTFGFLLRLVPSFFEDLDLNGKNDELLSLLLFLV